jgi:hypothetical protein
MNMGRLSGLGGGLSNPGRVITIDWSTVYGLFYENDGLKEHDTQIKKDLFPPVISLLIDANGLRYPPSLRNNIPLQGRSR